VTTGFDWRLERFLVFERANVLAVDRDLEPAPSELKGTTNYDVTDIAGQLECCRHGSPLSGSGTTQAILTKPSLLKADVLKLLLLAPLIRRELAA
jgi:hypothetical protein